MKRPFKEELKGFYLPLAWIILKAAFISGMGLWAYYQEHSAWIMNNRHFILYAYAFIAFLAFMTPDLEEWKNKLEKEHKEVSDKIFKAAAKR